MSRNVNEVPRTLVMGATGDLGSATAVLLRDRGHELVLHGFTNADKLAGLATTLGVAETHCVDVTDEVAIRGMFEEVAALDNLVYCPAINPTALKVADLPVDEWRRILDVNLTGAFIVVKAAIQRMRGRANPAIVLVSSIFGLQTPARRSAYGASKHGLSGITQAITREEGSWLRVNEVCPGPMWSENLRYILEKHAEAEDVSIEQYVLKRLSDVPVDRFMELEECANVIAFLCSTESSFMRGESIRIGGGAIQ